MAAAPSSGGGERKLMGVQLPLRAYEGKVGKFLPTFFVSMNKTYSELVHIATRAARAAGDIIRAGWGKTHQVEFKGAINLVTEIDHAAEKIILEQLRAATPEFDILTEETGTYGNGARFRWVIDPVDGTTNYAHGLPYFSVAIGLQENGVSVVGVVYDPIGAQLFTATRGGGAFLNDAPIQVSHARTLGESLVATGLVYEVWESERGIAEIVRLFKQARSVRILGSAALDICNVACGRLEAYCDTGLSEWDICAPRLILAEAGGTFQLYGDAARVDMQYCIASNGTIHAELERLLIDAGG